MSFYSAIRAVVGLLFISVSIAQIPDGLPIDNTTRQYLESLSPEALAAILKVFEQALSGQTPASAEVIQAQELYWSYDRSPPVYPTRK